MFQRAMQGDRTALEFLRVHSQVSIGGSAGWATQWAANDAAAKYREAKAAMDAATAAGITQQLATREQTLQAARDAESQRIADSQAASQKARDDMLEAQRAKEEAQVAARSLAEEKASEQQLITEATSLGGKVLQVVRDAVNQEERARTLGAGALGESSPLFQDAQRRADEALRNARQLVEQGLGQRAQDQAGQITPGYSIQRTITESTAGRFLGEQIIANAWHQRNNAVLERMYSLHLARLGAAGVGVPGDPAASLAAAYQQSAGMAGNSSMPAG